METTKKNYKNHYGQHWLALALLVLIPVSYRWSRFRVVLPTWPTFKATTPAASTVNWFFIIKMPEITTQHESGVDIMKTRLNEWLSALKTEGFHPMLLSEVLERLQKHQGVPERTVVTLFNPGYRRTYEIVNPILEQLQWPAVWLTDNVGMGHADRRLVTYHTTDLMKKSGLWDIGFQNKGGTFHLESRDRGNFSVGDDQHAPWTTEGGAFALNHGAELYDMNFLSINSSWLAPELINRLFVETPPTGEHVYLTKGIIQGREWGMTLPADRSEWNPRFDLKTPMNRRGTKLFFLGTQGYPNYQLHVESSYIVGEFWIQLRVDEVKGYLVDIIYNDKAVFVIQQMQNEKKRLYFGSHPPPAGGKGFSGDLTLSGTQVKLSFNGGSPVVVNGLRPPEPGRGILQIYIADKPHGIARADSVYAVFTPLSHP